MSLNDIQIDKHHRPQTKPRPLRREEHVNCTRLEMLDTGGRLALATLPREICFTDATERGSEFDPLAIVCVAVPQRACLRVPPS